MMTGRLFLLLLLLISPFFSSGQYMVKGEMNTLWPLQIQYEESGWHFAPGITRTFTKGEHSETFLDNDSLNYQADLFPKGKLGIYLEIGRYHRLENWKFFEYFDYSLAFKQLKGTERFEGLVTDKRTGRGIATPQGDGVFNDYYVTANANLNNWIQIGDKSFIQSSIGINFDYKVIDGYGFTGQDAYGEIGRERWKGPQYIGQAHFKLGYGHRLNEKWFMIPSLETPILNAYPWDNGKSTLQFFSTRYRPVILSLRFLIRKKLPPDECPPVPGGDSSKEKQEKFNKR